MQRTNEETHMDAKNSPVQKSSQSFRLYDPVLVVGPGRCGTTSMAKLVREMGIDMGEHVATPDHPEGNHEDTFIREINNACIEQKITPREWLIAFEQFVIAKKSMMKPWGFKNPLFCNFLAKGIEYFPHAKVIRCMRPIKDVVASMMRCYGWSENGAKELTQAREEMLTDVLKDRDHLVVQLSEWKTPTKLKRKVKDYLGDLVDEQPEPIKPKVLLAIPNLGNIHVAVVETMTKLFQDGRVQLAVHVPSAMPIEVIRNRIVQTFLESEADFLLFMDSDNPPRRSPFDLIFLEKDIVGFPTRMHTRKGCIYNTFTEQDGKLAVFQPHDFGTSSGFLEVAATGTGCMLIARRVLEEIRPRPFELLVDETGTKKVLGSDLNFCRKAREKGFRIWTHFEYPCSHFKNADLDIMAELVKDADLAVYKFKGTGDNASTLDNFGEAENPVETEPTEPQESMTSDEYEEVIPLDQTVPAPLPVNEG